MKIGDIVIALPYSNECKKTRGIIREIAFIGFYVSVEGQNELRFLVASEAEPVNCSIGKTWNRYTYSKDLTLCIYDNYRKSNMRQHRRLLK